MCACCKDARLSPLSNNDSDDFDRPFLNKEDAVAELLVFDFDEDPADALVQMGPMH